MNTYKTPTERPIGREELETFHSTTLKTWIGGAKKRQEDWEEPKNWYPHGVPSWHDKVIIGGYGRHQCIISSSVDDISALRILPGATLRLKKAARLTIDGLTADPMGILCDSGLYNLGIIRNFGNLSICNSNKDGINNLGKFINAGCIYADATVSNSDYNWGEFYDKGKLVFLLPS